MSYRNRKHYRVAQKSVEHSPQKGIFVSNSQKKHITMAGIAIIGVTFLNGIIVGHSIFRHH